MELRGNFSGAHKAYESGIARCVMACVAADEQCRQLTLASPRRQAQPVQRLKTKFEAFEKRMARGLVCPFRARRSC